MQSMVEGAVPHTKGRPVSRGKEHVKGPSVPRSGYALDMFFSSQSLQRGR
jgi:hypothetical protein